MSSEEDRPELMAAEQLSLADLAPMVVDAMPTLGRKLLMAGKSGLNLTKFSDEKFGDCLWRQRGPDPRDAGRFRPDRGRRLGRRSRDRDFHRHHRARFSPHDEGVTAAARLAGATGAAGARLSARVGAGQGSTAALPFKRPRVGRWLNPDICILALGGASWRRLGSDGAWVPWLRNAGVAIADFAPANAGLTVSWTPHMDPVLGQPVKGTALYAGNAMSRGEYIISQRGLEGGGIYAVSRAVREGADLHVDLMPDWDIGKIAGRLRKAKGSLPNRLRKGLNLDPARSALLMEFGHPLPGDLAPLIKRLPIRHRGLHPLDEAISSAGGIAWDALDRHLQVKALPGTFACGEMLDWEAPTGGWLLTACLATGRHAGSAAARLLGR